MKLDRATTTGRAADAVVMILLKWKFELATFFAKLLNSGQEKSEFL